MIKNEELHQIKAGAIKWGFGIAIGAILSLLVGIIDGYIRPLGCNE